MMSTPDSYRRKLAEQQQNHAQTTNDHDDAKRRQRRHNTATTTTTTTGDDDDDDQEQATDRHASNPTDRTSSPAALFNASKSTSKTTWPTKASGPPSASPPNAPKMQGTNTLSAHQFEPTQRHLKAPKSQPSTPPTPHGASTRHPPRRLPLLLQECLLRRVNPNAEHQGLLHEVIVLFRIRNVLEPKPPKAVTQRQQHETETSEGSTAGHRQPTAEKQPPSTSAESQREWPASSDHGGNARDRRNDTVSEKHPTAPGPWPRRGAMTQLRAPANMTQSKSLMGPPAILHDNTVTHRDQVQSSDDLKYK